MLQVIRYALDDSDDYYGLREVAFYMARQGVLIRYPLSEIIDLNRAGSTLAELRSTMHGLREQHVAELNRSQSAIGLPSQTYTTGQFGRVEVSAPSTPSTPWTRLKTAIRAFISQHRAEPRDD